MWGRWIGAVNHDVPPPLVGTTVAATCMQAAEVEVAAFDLGLDFQKSKAGDVIAGVEVYGPAYAAGLRDGQKLLTRSVVTPQTNKLEMFTVKGRTAGIAKSFPRMKYVNL